MAITVNTNIGAMQAQRNLNIATNGMNKAMERLSTGLRINNAGDDAAGLMIAKSLESQQRGSEVAIKNSLDGTNMLQVAEGNLATMQDNLLRIRDLALQAMNGSNGLEQVKALSDEANLRAMEIERTATGAKYGDFTLFSSTNPANIYLQVGAGWEKATNTIDIAGVFKEATFSLLTGSSMAATDFSFMNAAGTAVIDRAGFEQIIKDIDAGVKSISSRRGEIGATQARLEGTVEQLTIQNENLTAASSRIMDADIAQESSNFIKYQILQQASASLLVQANQTPNIAISLI